MSCQAYTDSNEIPWLGKDVEGSGPSLKFVRTDAEHSSVVALQMSVCLSVSFERLGCSLILTWLYSCVLILSTILSSPFLLSFATSLSFFPLHLLQTITDSPKIRSTPSYHPRWKHSPLVMSIYRDSKLGPVMGATVSVSAALCVGGRYSLCHASVSPCCWWRNLCRDSRNFISREQNMWVLNAQSFNIRGGTGGRTVSTSLQGGYAFWGHYLILLFQFTVRNFAAVDAAFLHNLRLKRAL